MSAKHKKIFKKHKFDKFEFVSKALKPYVLNLSANFLKFIKQLPIVINRLGYYIKIWAFMSKNSFLIMLSQKKLFFLFFLGKIFRFLFFAAFLYFLVSGAESLAGYSVNQTIFFFLTFNVVDILGQFLYREVYRFRPQLVSGDFDLTLVKPMNALFRSLMGGADIIDLITIPPLLIAVWYVGAQLSPNILNTIYYVLLIFNGFLISTSFHIAVLALGIITLEIDHTIMIYRDLVNLGRLPVDIYRQPLQGIITYLIPVGIMVTLPAKALMGLITPLGIIVSFTFGMATIFISLRFWIHALKQYSSASS